MIEHERKMQALDITVTIRLFIIGCVAGKIMQIYASDTWIAFNGATIGILVTGELIWWRARKRIKKKWEED